MRKVQIPKGNGRFRTIYIPDDQEKKRLSVMVAFLNEHARAACPDGVAHGFMPGCSPVTNAQAHVGFAVTVTMDLEDFFDHVTESQLDGKLSKGYLNRVLVDGAARQGLPTSPPVANIAAADMDRDIIAWLERNVPGAVMTRYADDLAVSMDDANQVDPVIRAICKIADDHGFTISTRKTKVQYAKAGRRIITGVGVDDKGVYPTRKLKRKLRAAEHRLRVYEAYRRKNPSEATKRAMGRIAAKVSRERREKYGPNAVRHKLGFLLRCKHRGLAEYVQLKPPIQPRDGTGPLLDMGSMGW